MSLRGSVRDQCAAAAENWLESDRVTGHDRAGSISNMTGRFGRIIAATCLAIALPLLLLAVAWLPAIVLAAIHDYQSLQIAGTPSYHHDMLSSLWRHVLSVIVYASAIGVAVGYVFIVGWPRSSRDRKLWTAGVVVAASDLGLWLPGLDFDRHHAAGLLLFAGIPATVAMLSTLGGWASWITEGTRERS